MESTVDTRLLNPAFGEPKIADVIQNNYCTSCGTCEAVCPVGVVSVEREDIDISRDSRNYRKADLHTEGWLKANNLSYNNNKYLTCVNCYACERVCPALDGFAEDEFENVMYKRAARSTSLTGQDGAVVSQIAASLLGSGAVDCVLGVTRDAQWRTDVILMTRADQVTRSAGTKYTYHPIMSYTRPMVGNHSYMPGPPLLDEQVTEQLKDFQRIALVGTPCQVHGARLLQREQEVNISLIIGLICMESFSYEVMSQMIIPEKIGFDLQDIVKMNIHKGKFAVHTKDEEKKLPLKEIMPYARNGCHHCIDYTSYFSDICVGSVGSDDGWSTVIVRTETGDQYLNQVQGLEYSDKPINMEILKKLTDTKHTNNAWDWKGFMKQKWYDEVQAQRKWGITPSHWGLEKLQGRQIPLD